MFQLLVAKLWGTGANPSSCEQAQIPFLLIHPESFGWQQIPNPPYLVLPVIQWKWVIVNLLSFERDKRFKTIL